VPASAPPTAKRLINATTESDLFARVKSRISISNYGNFLRIIDLYNNDLLRKSQVCEPMTSMSRSSLDFRLGH